MPMISPKSAPLLAGRSNIQLCQVISITLECAPCQDFVSQQTSRDIGLILSREIFTPHTRYAHCHQPLSLGLIYVNALSGRKTSAGAPSARVIHTAKRLSFSGFCTCGRGFPCKSSLCILTSAADVQRLRRIFRKRFCHFHWIRFLSA